MLCNRGTHPPATSAYRPAERRTFSNSIVDGLNVWLDAQLRLVSGRSTIAEAIRYAPSRWDGLPRFLNGRVELDTNPVERAIRPVTLGRKTTCSLPPMYAFLQEVLQRRLMYIPRTALGVASGLQHVSTGAGEYPMDDLKVDDV
ncbi:transposase [Bradyrhizobium sp. SZCCHNG3015]|uniref:IS66 family transposase n=1 Tax=Bradyrhizobium sp. SZCCHNG3015 TaxID=3057270 RepID=UPI0028EEDB73|nr:transposase [Bradyrhizobium sp. SZCCHNG3015]